MAAGDLTTLTSALQWVNGGDDDGTMTRLITSLSTQIQVFLGYQVASASYARTFNGLGGRKMILPDRPVTAVASLTIDGIPVPLSVLPAPGYLFDAKFLYVTGWYEFCRGVQNVSVTYTAGYQATPPEVEQACLDWIKLVHDGFDTLPGITKIRAGDSELTYGDPTTKLGEQTILIPPAIAAALQPYRRITST